jgi:hypothetical protein
MEDKLIKILDILEIDETEKLLEKKIIMDADARVLKRIHASVYKKTGMNERNQHKTIKRFVACIAAICLLCTTMFIFGIDNAQALIDKVFSFIPGYGISEYSDNSINYVISKGVSTENNNVIMTLRSVAASKNNISVFVTIREKVTSSDQNAIAKKTVSDDIQEDTVSPQNLYLYNDKSKYTSKTSVMSSSSGDKNVSARFDLETKDISVNKSYTLVYPEYNLSVSFTLQSVNSYSSLEEIGSTGYNNSISITAVPYLKDGKLIVDLYPLNESGYQILSLSKLYKGYNGSDLYLETDKGNKSYIPEQFPDSISAPNTRYTFNVSDGSKNFTIKIPYIIVQSNEQKSITISVPKNNQTLTLNQKVEFKDSTLIIKEVQRQTDSNGNNNLLKINLAYENKYANKLMIGAQFETIDFFGKMLNGSSGSDLNDNDTDITEYIEVESNDQSALRLRVFEPEYILLGEYSLKLNP